MHPLVGEARGYGLVGAVEMVADKATKRSFDPKAGVGRARGGVCRGGGADRCASLPATCISICPPLVITPQEIDELFDRLTRALDRTLDWAKREQRAACCMRKLTARDRERAIWRRHLSSHRRRWSDLRIVLGPRSSASRRRQLASA